MTTSLLRRYPHRFLAPIVTSAVALTIASCSSDDASPTEDGTTSTISSTTAHADDIEISYDVPERWDKKSVSEILESTMIGGGLDGGGGAVADGALFVGKELNQVQRSTQDGKQALDVTPLKDETVAQDGHLLESFSRAGEEYVALWRQGVPESNDDRRLGDESSSDSDVYLAVWDGAGEKVFDDPLPTVGSIGSIHSGLICDNGDLIDPLNGDTVFTDTGRAFGENDDEDDEDDEDDAIVGYGSDSPDPLLRMKAPRNDDDRNLFLSKPDYEHGTDSWNSVEVTQPSNKQVVYLETIMGNYAVFSVVAEGYSLDEMIAIDIETGEIAARGDDRCSFGNNENLRQPVQSSSDGKKVVSGEYMIDGSEGTFTCDKDRRGRFEPRLVLDDGTVYGYGSRGSGDDEDQVAASMKIGDDEALMEDGLLPFHVDGDGRGWFATSVDTDEGTETYVVVADPTDGQ